MGSLDHIPFARLLGIELEEFGDGRAVGSLAVTDDLTSNPETGIAHGAVPYALADTIGGVAATSAAGAITPTVDMRIDYLEPATTDSLRGEAEVVRLGASVATVDVLVDAGAGTPVATARGTYKTGGGAGSSPWTGSGDASTR